jgi:FkbM family methyltransferase
VIRRSHLGSAERPVYGEARSQVEKAVTRLLPVRVKNLVLYHRVFSDARSRRWFRTATVEGGPPGSVRLRALGGRPFSIRPGGVDPWVVWETFTYLDPLPPIGLEAGEVILDVGANIGAASALLAATFTDARIAAIEPDEENAALCERNLEPWRDRCQVVKVAAWPFDTTLGLAGESSATLSVRADDEARRVPAIAMNNLVESYGGRAGIGFIKMDVEGAEREILAKCTEWARRVRSISVEVHAPYSVEECTTDLRRLGFEVHLKSAAREPRVIGIRL